MSILLLVMLSWFSSTENRPLLIEDSNLSMCISEQTRPSLIQFNTNLIELGEINHGDIKEFEFEFTNVGEEDIEIEFMSSCDCTTLDYPLEAIKPGEKGLISVRFDSTEKTESETVDIDIDLVNKDEKGNPIFIRINYSFILIK